MFQNLKALVVVMGIALIVFMLAKPLCLRFMTLEDYTRRRNVWIFLTVTAFCSPSFWLYSVIALAVLAWAAQRDSNPLALYVTMLHVIPPIGLYIPVVGINQLFQLNNYRILSLAILVPFAVKVLRTPKEPGSRARVVADTCLLGYVLLQLVLLVPYETFTNTLRRGFLLTIDVVVVYYVFSRACTTRRAITDVMAAFVLTCGIYAPIALFETLKGWLLYQNLGDIWGRPIEFAFLLRGDTLRAQVSLGHSLALGYTMAIGFGFALYLGQALRSRSVALVLAGWMWMGLLAAYSRGPWLVAAVAFFTCVALQPGGMVRFVKYGFLAVVAATAVLVSPIGERVIDNLPFVGTVDAETVEYRRRLAEVSWTLIQQNPVLGNPFVLTQMEELRQGQGIIDLVNSYASIALLYGLGGLLLFVGVFLTGLWATQRTL
ncbi:MAG TPA: O-antigen ligase family protein, partial [Albitalea sp.]|nr:O-antigen ligase family protein [Albitalea sp.]